MLENHLGLVLIWSLLEIKTVLVPVLLFIAALHAVLTDVVRIIISILEWANLITHKNKQSFKTLDFIFYCTRHHCCIVSFF